MIEQGLVSMLSGDEMGISEGKSVAIDFFARFSNSDQFEKTFQEGMSLVEETANYLDGPGRVDARALDRTGAIAYATESMRLTTRLMQMASWLLLQRAVAGGELKPHEVQKEKLRINLADIGPGNPVKGSEQMPQGLLDLVEHSLRLLERIRVLDAMLKGRENASVPTPAQNAVGAQLSMLEQAFKQQSLSLVSR